MQFLFSLAQATQQRPKQTAPPTEPEEMPPAKETPLGPSPEQGETAADSRGHLSGHQSGSSGKTLLDVRTMAQVKEYVLYSILCYAMLCYAKLYYATLLYSIMLLYCNYIFHSSLSLTLLHSAL